MTPLEPGLCLEQALLAWDFGGEVLEATRFGKGHINDTFALSARQPGGGIRRYVLQRINTRVFKNPTGLMQNILGVTGYMRGVIAQNGGDPDRETLTVVPAKDGAPVFTAGDGGLWRCYYFIEGTVCHQAAASPAIHRAEAVAFGRFARLLEGYDAATLHETIPNFHNTPARFAQLHEALRTDPQNRAKGCQREVEFALEREAQAPLLVDLMQKGELPVRVTHNDTKLNNILMDPATNEGVCIIDLDTVMPGLLLFDFGDSVRFGANTATEDTREVDSVRFSLPLFEIYTAGYLEAAREVMWPLEKELMPWGARMMTLECGVRFLTDHLLGDVYFRVEKPGQNLARCKTQFKLVRDMEAVFGEMESIAQRLAG